MAPDNSAVETDKTERRRFSLAKLLPSLPTMNITKRKKSQKTNPLNMDDLKISFDEAEIKIVLVGAGNCGKTRLLIVASKGDVPESYIPTVYENYSIEHTVDNVSFHMRLWDTAGQEDYDRLRPLSYQGANVICICFAVGDAESLEIARTKFAPEIEHFNKGIGAAKFLLGFRGAEELERGVHVGRSGDEVVRGAGRDEGEKLAAEIGAHKYIECDLTKAGADTVFSTILGMVLEASPGLRKRVPASQG